MMNVSKLKIFVFAQSLLAILIISFSAIASESPSITPCTQQSDSKQPCLIELPEEAIQKLTIDAGFGWGIFSGTIYNGNKNYHVTQLVVSMEPVHDHHMDMHSTMSHDPRIHHIDLELPPISKGALSMPLANEDAHVHAFKWKVVKVIGYQSY